VTTSFSRRTDFRIPSTHQPIIEFQPEEKLNNSIFNVLNAQIFRKTYYLKVLKSVWGIR
jgi:hypothetical protein